MLEESRVNEAKRNLSVYLDEGLVVKKSDNQELIEIYIKNSISSLNLAKKILDEKLSNLWIVVISYYYMFYIANALILSMGYKIRDKIVHKVTADLLISLLRDKMKKSLLNEYDQMKDTVLVDMKVDSLISNFDRERKKRGNFQYKMSEDIEYSKASTSYNRAKEFYRECFKLLN